MVEPNIYRLISGYNCSLLAYGQSGAGKTFTVGLNDKSSAGMISLAIESLLLKLQAGSEPFDVGVSFVEIYQEKVYDLLSENSTESIYSKGRAYNGSTKVSIESSQEALEILRKGNKNRHVRATTLNSSSSRSHAMFTIILTREETSSVMHICDLAGSEGLRNTNHSGVAQQEGVTINQGLLAIGKVVKALSSGSKLIPYRDSVLTTVLQDSLNTRSYLTILACISPARKDKNETMSTIRFAQSVKVLDNKSVPEFNAYMKEKQRLQARTPLKPYMLPLSRNENSKTPGKALSKTPGKMLPPSAAKFTSTAKKTTSVNRFHSFTTPSKAPPVRNPLRQTDVPQTSDMSYIDQNTFNIMNCSTSTEFEAPAATPNLSVLQQNLTMPSFSPLMRQIEKTIDLKLNTFMDTLKSQTIGQTTDITQFHETIKKAVMNNVGGEVEALNATFDLPDEPMTSTVLRKPAEPRANLMKTTLEMTCFEPRRLDTTEFDETSPFNFTAPQPVRKQNRRVTSVVNEAVPTRRSTRISLLKEVRESKNASKRKSLEKPKPTRNVLPAFLDRSSTRKISKSDHKKEILDLLNTGTMNQLKLLPKVGLKTAYQILTYRTMHGKFKTVDDVKKVPGMKGKIWENFLEGNMLK